MFICFSSDLVVHLLQVGSLDMRSSRALIFSHISAGPCTVLRRGRPEGGLYGVMLFSFQNYGMQDLFSYLAIGCPLYPYDIGASFPALS